MPKSKPPVGKLYCKTCVIMLKSGKPSKRPFTYTITKEMIDGLHPGAIHQLGCCPKCEKPMHYFRKGVTNGKKNKKRKGLRK